MRTESLFLLTVLATATAACGTPETAEDPTFEALVERVLAPSCTFSSCHANPTNAAALDLSPQRACDTLVNQPSCLFPDRMRIVPGHPEDSFFFHKLAGQALEEAPTGSCGTQTNVLMPYGAAALPDDELQLVHNWIAAGASCTPSGKSTGPAEPAIASLTATKTTPLAGESIKIFVTLDQAAPAGGIAVTFDIDPNAMAAPFEIVIPEGASRTEINALAMRPASRFAVRATAGKSSRELALRVEGLEIAEVLADPIGDDDQLQWVKIKNRGLRPVDLSEYRLQAGQGSYNLITVALTGMIPAGGCAVIGGPIQSGSNSEPVFFQAEDFSPNLPHSGNQAAGFAVFDRLASAVSGIPTPVDTMLIGATNDAQLRGPDAEIAAPFCDTPTPGMSALRTGKDACVQAAMQPADCPP
jgi:hypothetical protein